MKPYDFYRVEAAAPGWRAGLYTGQNCSLGGLFDALLNIHLHVSFSGKFPQKILVNVF
jgi:hypothetical protein